MSGRQASRIRWREQSAELKFFWRSGKRKGGLTGTKLAFQRSINIYPLTGFSPKPNPHEIRLRPSSKVRPFGLFGIHTWGRPFRPRCLCDSTQRQFHAYGCGLGTRSGPRRHDARSDPRTRGDPGAGGRAYASGGSRASCGGG